MVLQLMLSAYGVDRGFLFHNMIISDWNTKNEHTTLIIKLEIFVRALKNTIKLRTKRFSPFNTTKFARIYCKPVRPLDNGAEL